MGVALAHPAPAAPSLVILPVPTEAVASPRACSLEGGSLRCLHPYSTQDARGRPFRSGAGEVLDVLLRHPSGVRGVGTQAP